MESSSSWAVLKRCELHCIHALPQGCWWEKVAAEFQNSDRCKDWKREMSGARDVGASWLSLLAVMTSCLMMYLSALQLIIALEYCHGKGIVNRDLKPENTLIMTRQGMPFVKLCDFG